MIRLEVSSPFGSLYLTEEHGALVALDWHEPTSVSAALTSAPSSLLQEAAQQLSAYFDQRLTAFDLPVNPRGNAFQRSVCEAMLKIPYGETTTYGALAEQLGSFAQPIGNACGNNSIPIIIPCHRVLAAHGLGGYSGDGGVERKIELLKLEGGFNYLL